MTIKYERTKVTPKLAATWIERDEEVRTRPGGPKIPPQRTFRRYHKDFFVGVLGRGEWKENGDAICITAEGAVINGQHRLAAVRDSGISAWMCIALDVPHETFHAIDVDGKPRNQRDVVTIAGYGYAAEVISGSRLIMAEDAGITADRWTTQKYSTEQFLEWIIAHPAIVPAAKLGGVSPARRIISASVVTYLHYRLSDIDQDMAETLIHDIGVGADLSAKDPVLTLRQRMLTAKMKRTGFPVPEQAHMCIHCWNYRRKGTAELTKIYVQRKPGEFWRMPGIHGRARGPSRAKPAYLSDPSYVPPPTKAKGGAETEPQDELRV